MNAVVEVPVGPVIEFKTLAQIIAEKRAPRWLLPDVLEAGVIAVLAGARGTFKSFIALEWAMRIAMDDVPVLLLSGEGAGLGMRGEAWQREHAPTLDAKDLQILALERPLALTVAQELDALSDEIAALPKTPALIVLDTWSKFAGSLDENSNSEVAAYLSSLSRSLRERFSSTVLIVAHTGHTESGRPRGASSLTANTDAEYIVTRQPLSMTVAVSRERFKDTPSLPPLGYEARPVDLGRLDSLGRTVTSLALHSTEAPQVATKTAGKNQNTAMVALREWARSTESPHISSDELTKILRAQGIADRRRRAETVAFLSNAGALSPAVGGHTVNRGAL